MRAASLSNDPYGVLWTSDTLVLRQCSVSSMDNNVYLVTCRHTGEQLLVDAADDLERIDRLIEHGTADHDTVSTSSIVTTHRHLDHHRALSGVQDQTGARTLAGSDDADHLPVPVDVRLAHGDVVAIGDVEIAVLALRGHTPGSVALAIPGGDPDGTTLLVTGDSLFPGGPGKTESAADFTSLVDDLEGRVFGVYADSTIVLPGHGDGTTLGTERPQLRDWRQRGW